MAFIRGTVPPGVQVTVNTAMLGAPAPPESSDVYFAAGWTPWGPVARAVTITGLSDYNAKFGGLHPNSHLASSVHNFFRQGGRRAVVCRVVGPAAAVATRTFVDRAVAPVNTARVDARDPSSSVDVRVKVEAGTLANTVRITARSLKLDVIEVFDNFKLTFTQQELDDITGGVSRLESVQTVNARSELVRLTDLGSGTAAPNNLPALLAEVTLAGGSDDFGSLNDASFIGVDNGGEQTGLQVFNTEDLGTGQVALPGVTTQAAHAALIAHAEKFYRFALLDPALGSDADDVVAARALVGSSYAAMYWPWVEQQDLTGTGVKKFYPPSGHVAGVYARAEGEIGVHKAPANYLLYNVLDVERSPGGAPQVNDSLHGYLNQREINVIRHLREQGVKVYGARCLASFGRVTAVHQQRILNRIRYDLKKSFQVLVFGVLDAEGRIFREARSIGEQYLGLLYRDGALTSPSGDERDAYVVICDSNNNPAAALDQHILNVQVGVHLVGMAEMIFLDINSVPLATSLDVLRQ